MNPSIPIMQRRDLWSRACCLFLFLLLGLGLSIAPAANLLTNPGFEDGQTGWANPNTLRGGNSIVLSNPAMAHSGNNYVSNYNATGNSSLEQGDSAYGWSTGVSLPVSGANFYRLSAWVKVPGASTNPQPLTLRYRFEGSGNRVDVGTQTINTENWTFLQSPWLQPAPGDSAVSYWETRSLNNAVVFYADDCALDESTPLTLNGRVVNSSGAGVDGATVTASSSGWTTTPTTTAGGGYYSFTLPAGTYSVGAYTSGYLGNTNVAVSSDPTTAPNIVLSTDPNYDPELLFFVRSADYTPGSSWAAVEPPGTSCTQIGTPGTRSFGGVKWEQNNRITSNDGFRVFNYSAVAGGPVGVGAVAIPCSGITMVTAAKPVYCDPGGEQRGEIVDMFYDELFLAIQHTDGRVLVARNGQFASSPTGIPNGQTTIVSLTVQTDGSYQVYTNGALFWTNGPDTTANAAVWSTGLIPGVTGDATFKHYVNIGRNDPDGWSAYNGYIGDVYVYTTVISDTKRAALEASLMNKFITNATLSYTITASTPVNGTITPAGATTVVQGYDKSYTISANSGYVVSDVQVDGTSKGPVTSYTFSNVSANHTIAASFVTMPPQTITATAGANGTITPSGSISVPAGTDQTFALVPNTGYAVSNVVVDGVSMGEIYSYTFPFVLAPHTISVTFRALDMNIPMTGQLIFSVVANVLPGDGTATGPWPTYVPAGKTLTVIGGAPTSVIGVNGVGTNIWENNVRSTSDRYRYPGGTGAQGEYLAPIPCPGGASIAVVAAPNTGAGGADAWNSLVDVFYDRLTLGIRNDTGAVFARVNGNGANSTGLIPSGQPTILTMVVQPDGSYKVWANSTLVMSGTSSALTSLVPGVDGYKHYINVGGNDPDGWTSFNGNIGDVFLYKTALSYSDRHALEVALGAKYGIAIPTTPFSGKVTLQDGTTPVAGAVVAATGLVGTQTGTSAADGTYSFFVVNGDTYDVAVTKVGYAQTSANFSGVISGATVYNFQMHQIETIQGTVKNAGGDPIYNAVVQIGEAGPAGVTDALGKYSIIIAPGPGVSFYADALGYADHTETIDTSAAATGVITKDVVLTAKNEADYTYSQNGGFESGTLTPWTGDGSPKYGVTTAEHAGGSYSAYWQSTVAAWYEGYLSQTVPVVEGSTYNVYFKVKTSAAVGQCGFNFVDAAGNTTWWGYAGAETPGANWMYNTVPNVWEQALNYRSWDNAQHLTAVRVTPPAGTVSIQFILGLGADAIGQMLYIDDAVVDRVGPVAPPLVPAITLPGGVPNFKFLTLLGHNYRMVYKNALTDTTWSTITGSAWTAGTGAEVTLTDTTTTGQSHRYYRLEIQ